MKQTNSETKSLFNKINKSFSIPGERAIDFLLHRLSCFERAILTILVIVFISSTFGMLWKLNNQILVSVPVQGGEIIEGVVGVPRSVNPLLASSESDRDLVALIYSGLMRASDDNSLVPDLAESYEISDDGKTYTFKLKDNITWHDGEIITSDDVIFTIQRVQDSLVRSIKRGNWDGVAIERVDARTVRFVLEQAYSPFIQNTTLGILPKHLWDDVEIEFFSHSKLNSSPIGSGPYKINSIKRDRDGIPVHYDLQAFDNFALGAPYISNLQMRFYPNELALIDGLIAGEVMNINSISPDQVSPFTETHTVFNTPLPRIFGAFFNQNQSQLFTDPLIRRVLDESINKEHLVESVLEGYGTVISGPIPPGSLGYIAYEAEDDTVERIDAANTLLDEHEWTENENGIRSNKIDGTTHEFVFSVSTSDTPELMEAAAILANTWEKIGANVEVKVFEKGDLEQHVIRPREYDVLLFGEIIGRDADPYPFWHSSQRLDPGLNIALYTNITVDEALEHARTTTDTDERIAEYQAIQKEIRYDTPATFLYSPEFIYITNTDIHNMNIGSIKMPAERFLNIHEWYMKTDTIWRAFAESSEIIQSK